MSCGIPHPCPCPSSSSALPLMRLISHIQVLQFSIPVYEDPVLRIEDDLGTTEFVPELAIRIHPDLRSDQRGTVILHEAIHVLDHLLGLDLTEAQTRALEVGIPALLLDNPTLRRRVLRRGGPRTKPTPQSTKTRARRQTTLPAEIAEVVEERSRESLPDGDG